MKASLKNHRQSPRKVRLLADLVRGKKVDDAVVELTFANKRASTALKKLIDSAVANAENNNQVKRDNLYIKEIAVDKGAVLKRWQPAYRGTAHRINKRSSHIKVVLDVKK